MPLVRIYAPQQSEADHAVSLIRDHLGGTELGGRTIYHFIETKAYGWDGRPAHPNRLEVVIAPGFRHLDRLMRAAGRTGYDIGVIRVEEEAEGGIRPRNLRIGQALDRSENPVARQSLGQNLLACCGKLQIETLGQLECRQQSELEYGCCGSVVAGFASDLLAEFGLHRLRG